MLIQPKDKVPIVLDEKNILQIAENIRNGKGSEIDLYKALGGDRLKIIFDDNTIKSLITEIVNCGRFHKMLPGNFSGINILEGLLNNRIIGDLSNFYCIKSSYILDLSTEEQKKMAQAISAGREDLYNVLLNLWNKGIATEACNTKSEDGIPMVQMSIGTDDENSIYFINQVYKREGIFGDITCYATENRFQIRLLGKKLYEYLQQDKLPEVISSKTDLFKTEIENAIAFWEENCKYYHENGISMPEAANELNALKKLLEQYKSKKNPWELTDEERIVVNERMHEVCKTNSNVHQDTTVFFEGKEVDDD